MTRTCYDDNGDDEMLLLPGEQAVILFLVFPAPSRVIGT